jgi:glutamyl-Q tRNA(Asp) synthetase
MPLPDDMPDIVTRFAPSPTGQLHLGHAWSALQGYDLARSRPGGRLCLRIEDIDGGRSRPEYVAGIMADLRWLGLSWDGEPVIQSARTTVYRIALERLIDMDLAYPCFCSRADIAAQIAASASAPHGTEDGAPYPGTCRDILAAETEQRIASGEPHAWRLDVSRAKARCGPLHWWDHEAGERTAQIAADDIVLWRKDAPGSYHLCAVVDDGAMGITHIVRGQDLESATGVHRLLQALLDLPAPTYRHHRLLVGPDGRRLAKRDGGWTIAAMRTAGTNPAQLLVDLRAGRFPIGITLA